MRGRCKNIWERSQVENAHSCGITWLHRNELSLFHTECIQSLRRFGTLTHIPKRHRHFIGSKSNDTSLKALAFFHKYVRENIISITQQHGNGCMSASSARTDKLLRGKKYIFFPFQFIFFFHTHWAIVSHDGIRSKDIYEWLASNAKVSVSLSLAFKLIQLHSHTAVQC